MLIGLIPLNWDWTPPEAGIDVYLISSAIHADIMVPIANDVFDWSTVFPRENFRGDAFWATHYAIGWGDRGFYLHTPTWNDLKASTAANAMLLPSQSVLHVACTGNPSNYPGAVPVKLDAEAYGRLCASIRRSLLTDAAGMPKKIEGHAYHDFDAFYEAQGAYHCFNTCNSWVGRRLNDAGVSTPLFTPLPGEPLLYLD